jgi:DNA-directed RNA polymerase beta subunit
MSKHQSKGDESEDAIYKKLESVIKEKLNIGDFSIKQDDLFLVGDSEIDDKGLVNHHLSSANDLYTNGITQIITTVFKVEKDIDNQRDSTPEDKEIDRINVLIKFTDVFISRPTMINYYSGKEEVLYPNVALLKDKTYSANLRVNATIKATAYMKNGNTKVRTDEIKNFKLCRVPVMVRSILCNTHDCSKEALVRMNEDPSDPGGYFIIKGVEWVIDCIENILFNQIRVFKNEGYSKEIMRVEFVSKPGDTYQNSDYFLVRLLNDNQLTCEIVRDKFKGLQIPFYLLFRLLGWAEDKILFDNIMYGYGNDISKNMMNYVIDSINAKYALMSAGRYIYNQSEVMKLIVDEMKYTEFKYLELDEKPENYQIAYNSLYRLIDTSFLPHVGLKPEDRPKKLRFLALIIRKLLLVRMGNMEPTDRDSYKSKRIHAAGTSYAKSFKTYFNASIIQQIKRRLIKDFRSMSFSQVDLASSVKSSVYGADFERSIMQTITSGNKSQITVNKKARTNRLSSQLLDRKNQIAVYATLRQVTTTSTESSKQSERANEMRRVHMSFLGYICIIHSPDGEKVGINKQLALFSSILGATSSEVIKDILLNDKSIIALHKVTTEMIYEESLTNVYVNGEWIGCTKNSLQLVKKYRKMRRNFDINPLTTIYWDNTQDEAYFWVDVGRVVRPLLIVYNNQRDSEQFSNKVSKFTQGIGITQKIIDGLKAKTIGVEYLLRNNIIEYITPEEQENCYLCPFFDQLKDDKNNELHEYTHCDIPQAILGITALTSPYANHNQTPRITFQTSQCKQTCGVFTLNWPYRCDKDTFLQYTCETPLVKTVASKYIFPNGCNAIVAIACYSGFNQEDSLVVSQGSVDRGLFNGCKFTYYKDDLEQREEFGNPDAATTTDIKSGSYSKLKDGIIKIGTKVNKGDAVIGKYMRIPKTSDQDMTMSDRSTIYKENEEAIVHNVIVDRNEEDERFCKVAIRKIRPVAIGDKFSSRSGQKGVTGILLRDSDMPFTKDGIRPSIIMNPHAIPSRMTIGQLYESLNGNWCAATGTHTDATMFKYVDIESMADELEKIGMNRHGYHRLYSGLTGEFIDCMIFMGPTYYQRLQKFVIDAVYSISQGPSDVLSRQPLDGKASGGGIRIGEMERDVLCAHGASKFLQEKFFGHSDGFTEYICRCGKAAVVNTKRNIYKCKYCKDNADISAVPTSWSSKLFMQEMETMNVGIRRHLTPYIYESVQEDVVKDMISDVNLEN